MAPLVTLFIVTVPCAVNPAAQPMPHNGFVLSSEFRLVQGKELLSAFSLKQGRQRHFCSRCGSPVYSSNAADPSRIRIRLGILDSVITERPISHNFVSSKACWDNLDADLPRYDGHEPGRS